MAPSLSTNLSSWQNSASDGMSTISDGSGVYGSTWNPTAANSPPSSSTIDGASGGSSSPKVGPPTTTVVAGVVGGVAGLAVVVFLAMLLLRWKRRQGSGLRLLNDGNRSQSFTAGNRPGPGGPSGHSVAERLLPFAVPASLAALTGHKRLHTPPSAPSEPSDSPERSFYRVSGKKLTSVLESGGDGYSEPQKRHESVQSMRSTSSYYRDSHGWYGDPANLPRLQLGSPIPRPDDGFPIMRAGPARTPVTEEGPLHLPRQLTP
jgi:hypothetical protein